MEGELRLEGLTRGLPGDFVLKISVKGSVYLATLFSPPRNLDSFVRSILFQTFVERRVHVMLQVVGRYVGGKRGEGTTMVCSIDLIPMARWQRLGDISRHCFVRLRGLYVTITPCHRILIGWQDCWWRVFLFTYLPPVGEEPVPTNPQTIPHIPPRRPAIPIKPANGSIMSRLVICCIYVRRYTPGTPCRDLNN